MKTLLKILLPKTTSYWEALIKGLSNIKPRFTLHNLQRFGRLKIFFKVIPITLLIFYLLGYQPTFGFPPIKKNVAAAQESSQTQEVVAEILPQFQLPLSGYISNKFSWYHPGIDIATGFGTPIYPIAEGVVLDTTLGFFGYGNHVIITHQNGFNSLYGHMDKVYIKKDQKITLTDNLGTVGMSGFTSGPHIHLEISKDGKNINPETLLPKIQDYPQEKYLVPYEILPNTKSETQKLTKTLKLDL